LYALFKISFTFISIFFIVSSDINGLCHSHEYESICHTKFSAQISSNIQNLITICLAIEVALSISLLAQVVILSFPKNISSAALHQYKVANSSKYFDFEVSKLSLSGKNQVTHKAHHLETILTL
jgi:hypothetical protein